MHVFQSAKMPLCRRTSIPATFKLLMVFVLVLLGHSYFFQALWAADKSDQLLEDIEIHVKDRPIPVYWQHPHCGCVREVPKPEHTQVTVTSSCGTFSTLRGPHQKVVSYSFYGDTKSGYFKGVSINTKSIAKLYPGWTVRLYHNISPKNPEGMKDLCSLFCTYSNLDECYVEDLERSFIDLQSKFGMLWRFMVMGDPTVDVFAVRDLDSPVYQREVDAVSDWLATNKTFHIMRDNPAHVTHILGGMWGARNTNDNLKEMQEMRQKILDGGSSWFKSFDQLLLSRIVWPIAKSNMVAHDSFLCQAFEGTKPWPSKRSNFTFVGDMEGLYIRQTCPEECRPLDHKDWIYC